MNDFGLYVIITAPTLAYETIAEICVAEDIKMLQLREKNLSDRELLIIGKNIRDITKGTKTNFIINDRVDIACILDADGFHLGQDDLPLPAVKEAFFSKDSHNVKITGLSTHSLLQLQNALGQNPDYVGFGPIYSTPTKALPDPVVGADALNQAIKIADKPVVAIGGINEDNIDEVLAAGARNVALVRYFMETTALRERLRFIKTKIKSYQEEQ